MADSMDKIAARNRVACTKPVSFFAGDRGQGNFGAPILKKQTHFQNITCLPDNSIEENGFNGLNGFQNRMAQE